MFPWQRYDDAGYTGAWDKPKKKPAKKATAKKTSAKKTSKAARKKKGS